MASLWPLLQHLGPLVGARITIAIEPLNRQESNIVNRLAEGLQLVREVHHPHVQLLVDYYHLMIEREVPQIVVEAGRRCGISTSHASRGERFPLSPMPTCPGFLHWVRKSGYDGRCSIEAFTSDFAAEAGPSLRATLREAVASL